MEGTYLNTYKGTTLVFVWKGYRKICKFRRLVGGYSLRQPGFNSRRVHVGSVAEEVAWDRFLSEHIGTPLPISSVLETHLSSVNYGSSCGHQSHCTPENDLN